MELIRRGKKWRSWAAANKTDFRKMCNSLTQSLHRFLQIPALYNDELDDQQCRVTGKYYWWGNEYINAHAAIMRAVNPWIWWRVQRGTDAVCLKRPTWIENPLAVLGFPPVIIPHFRHWNRTYLSKKIWYIFHRYTKNSVNTTKVDLVQPKKPRQMQLIINKNRRPSAG